MVTTWLEHYGYIVLFLALMLELIAFGIPTEVLMSYAGFLVSQGKLSWGLSIFMAGLGSSIGITISYWIGFKLGSPFFEKYGHKIHLGPERLETTSRWFNKYGNKLLIVAYFIPGIRHITGYFSGITKISFRAFALYAYIGAFLWVSTFISLGKVLGPTWEQYHHSITKYLIIAGIVAAAILVFVYLYRKHKLQMLEFAKQTLKKGEEIFRSPRRVKMMIVISFFSFLLLFGFMIGLIQDLFANEFTEFDTVASFLIHAIFDLSWSSWMNGFGFMASSMVLLPVIAFTFLWIVLRGKDRMLESIFLLIVVLGGEMWDEVLRRLFHRVGPLPSSEIVRYTFPSEQTFMTLTILGFAAFLIVRHTRSVWIRYAAPLIAFVVPVLVGLSRIYFDVQYPSDVVAGYVFSGVWLSLNIVLLEIFRILRKERTNFLA